VYVLQSPAVPIGISAYWVDEVERKGSVVFVWMESLWFEFGRASWTMHRFVSLRIACFFPGGEDSKNVHRVRGPGKGQRIEHGRTAACADVLYFVYGDGDGVGDMRLRVMPPDCADTV